MRLGIVTGTPGPPLVFDPATIASLTGWWKGSFTASPWVDSSSNGNNLSEATHPPTAGTALDGKTPASFNGTNSLLTAAGTVATYFGTGTSGSFWSFLKVTAIVNDNPDSIAYFNDPIFFDSNNAVGCAMRSTGPAAQFMMQDSAFAIDTAHATIATGAYILVQGRWDGTLIEVRKNNGAWGTASSGTGHPWSTAGTITVCKSALGGFTTALLEELAFCSAKLSDADFDNVYSYVKATYPSAGLP